MTQEEIDNLLLMLNEKNIEEVKQYLINYKKTIQDELRQERFENYLTNNAFGMNFDTMPKLYFSDKEQMFTNHVSLYIINSCFFKTDTQKLSNKENNLRKFTHKYKLETKDNFEKILGKIYLKYNNQPFQDIKLIKEENKVITKHVHNNKTYENTFDLREIVYSDCFLNYPTYKISPNIPILYAENEIGKVYILGHRKN